MLRVLAAVLVLVTVLGGGSGGARAAEGYYSVRGDQILDPAGRPVFLLGGNYEGPADRAWRMWDDGLFDPNLIDQDFARARAAGLGVLRVFVQQSLADDVRAGRWAKLDRVLDLADRRGLKLILTFADYAEANLGRLTVVDAIVARRYRGRSTILAYDLKNEPRFGDLAFAEYPTGVAVPLRDPALVEAVGESVARGDIVAYRATDQGRRDIPQRLDDDGAWVYTNVLTAYRQFLRDGQAWGAANGSNSVGYFHSPDSAAWGPLKDALNGTLAAWMTPRIVALRSADPDRLLTIGHADPIVASLPVNWWLDYRTLHRYPVPPGDGLAVSMGLFDQVRAAVPDQPLVLGEFGISNATVDEESSAALEARMARAVCRHGGAGALKWMLNDFPQGANPRENAFGMYRADGSPKPVVAAFRGLGTLRPPTC